MSYARFGWGGCQVYVYADVSGGITCCMCLLNGGSFNTHAVLGAMGEGQTAADYQVMLAHLADHEDAGHFVPLYCTEALRNELDGATDRPLSPEAKAQDQAAMLDMAEKMEWPDDFRKILGIPLMRDGRDNS